MARLCLSDVGDDAMSAIPAIGALRAPTLLLPTRIPKGLHNSTPGKAHVAPPPSAVKLLPITDIEGLSMAHFTALCLFLGCPSSFAFKM